MSNPLSESRFKNLNKILVMRKYNNPTVEVFAEEGDLGIRMAYDDFIAALVAEIGSPAFMFTQKTLQQHLLNASKVVINDMKKMSVYL